MWCTQTHCWLREIISGPTCRRIPGAHQSNHNILSFPIIRRSCCSESSSSTFLSWMWCMQPLELSRPIGLWFFLCSQLMLGDALLTFFVVLLKSLIRNVPTLINKFCRVGVWHGQLCNYMKQILFYYGWIIKNLTLMINYKTLHSSTCFSIWTIFIWGELTWELIII